MIPDVLESTEIEPKVPQLRLRRRHVANSRQHGLGKSFRGELIWVDSSNHPSPSNNEARTNCSLCRDL